MRRRDARGDESVRVAACRVCKVLETRCPSDEERIGELERQTNECRIVTEELDRKYDEVLSALPYFLMCLTIICSISLFPLADRPPARHG